MEAGGVGQQQRGAVAAQVVEGEADPVGGQADAHPAMIAAEDGGRAKRRL